MPDPSPSNADSLKLQLLIARKKEWWLATADSLPQAVLHTLLVVGGLALQQRDGLDQRSYSTLGLVSTWMGDHVRVGKPSQYLASQLGRLSHLLSVGW